MTDNKSLDWPLAALDESNIWRSPQLTYAERMEIISAFVVANLFYLNQKDPP